MSAPSSVWPVWDVVELAQEAAERAGIEFRSGYALRTARRSLELLLISWANRGYNLWTVEGPDTLALQPGVYEYTLPDDTVDLIEHVLRQTNPNGTYNDFPLDRMSLPEYSAINNKLAQGRPSILNMRREISPYFDLWMVPPLTPAYSLVYWRLRRMKSVGTGGTGTPEIPWRFVPAMIAGLAFHLALKSKDPLARQRVPMLKTAYDEEFQLASDEDRDRAAFRFIPGGYQFL